MDRAKKFGFMTVTNFMAEVKVRIYIIRVLNHSPLPMVHWLDSDLIPKLLEIFENYKNFIAIWSKNDALWCLNPAIIKSFSEDMMRMKMDLCHTKRPEKFAFAFAP